MIKRFTLIPYLLAGLLICMSEVSLRANNTTEGQGLELRKVIKGNIRPKSIVHNGKGLFFAQNMMYRHSVTVYDRNYQLLHTIKDNVRLSAFGHNGYSGNYMGAPVEATFSHGGKYAWVSNYQMYGKGFSNPGKDDCPKSQSYDKSFVYKINTETAKIKSVIKVGCVPKHIAASPDNKYVLVTNWCSGDLSIIHADMNKVVKRIDLGRFPRGIVIDSNSEYAYITLMSSAQIAMLNLNDYTLSWMTSIGRGPRHLCLSPDDKYLYATLNHDARIAKIQRYNAQVLQKAQTGRAPRSMTISDDGKYLYVVNYLANTMSKIRTDKMEVVQTVKTHAKPIGITFDAQRNMVWVACYTGSIMVFEDMSMERDEDLASLLPYERSGHGSSLSLIGKPYDTRPTREELADVSIPKPEKAKQTEDPGTPTKTESKPVQLAEFSQPVTQPVVQPKVKKPAAPKPEPKPKVKDTPKSTKKSVTKPTPPKPKPKPAPVVAKKPGRVIGYCVVLGTFKVEKNANNRVSELHKFHIDTKVVKGADSKFRIVTRRYGREQEALIEKRFFKEKHQLDGWVMQVRENRS